MLKNNLNIIIILFLFTIGFCSYSYGQKGTLMYDEISREKQFVDSLLSLMTLEEKVGQMTNISFNGRGERRLLDATRYR